MPDIGGNFQNQFVDNQSSRSIAESLCNEVLDLDDPDWLDAAREVRERRFGEACPGDSPSRARQARFLQQRGFTGHQVRKALDQN